MSDVKNTLEQRGKTHGNFNHNANVAMQTRALWRSAMHWGTLTTMQQLALDEIALKVARILSVEQQIREPWHDIAGYATLIESNIAVAPATTTKQQPPFDDGDNQ